MWKKPLTTEMPQRLALSTQSRPPHAANSALKERGLSKNTGGKGTPHAATVMQAKVPHAAQMAQWKALPPHAALTRVPSSPYRRRAAAQAMMADNRFYDEAGCPFSTPNQTRDYFRELEEGTLDSVHDIWDRIKDQCVGLVSLNVERTWKGKVE